MKCRGENEKPLMIASENQKTSSVVAGGFVIDFILFVG